jgi:hypothetical protein
MKGAEYFVYFISSYGKFQEDSKEKQFEYKIDEKTALFLNEWLDIYQSQAKLRWTWKMDKRYVKKVRVWTYAIFRYEDIGKYFNF